MSDLMFERDLDQAGVPAGYTAYVLRWWTMFYSGRVRAVSVGANGYPSFDWEEQTHSRLPNFVGETSRLFVRDDAKIDPAALQIQAKPLPASLEACHPRYPKKMNSGNNA